jgi:serine/threonine-protein kinase
LSEEEIQIIDDYKLLNAIATGSSSQVWEVQDMTSNEHYAMKLLLPEAMKSAEQKRILKYESTICKKFDHPNIIRMHAYKQGKQFAYFIMDYFAGPNIKQLLRNNLGQIQMRFRRLAECVALGLGHMHEKGIVHRDVKPDNVLMNKSGEVKMIDFSLSSSAPNPIVLMLGLKSRTIAGTRTYLSPEVIKKLPATFQSDIYSYGVMLYECLTGRPPFMGGNPNELLIKHVRDRPTNPSSIEPNVTAEMDAFIHRLLAKSPKDRPKGIPDLIAEFRNIKIFKEDPEEFLKSKLQKAEDKKADSVTSRLDSREDAARQEQKRSSGGIDLVTPALESMTPAPPTKSEPAASKIGARKSPPPPPPAPPGQAKQPGQNKQPGNAPQPGMPRQPLPPPQFQQPPPGYAAGMPMQPMMPGMPQGMQPGMQPGAGQYPQQMPGYYPPGSMQPGQMPPGQMPPGQMPPGQMPPGQMPPGQMPGGYQMHPGQMQPGQMQPGQMPPGAGQYPQQMPPQGYPQNPAGQPPIGRGQPVANNPNNPPVRPGQPPAKSPPQPPKQAAKPADIDENDLPTMDELPPVV